MTGVHRTRWVAAWVAGAAVVVGVVAPASTPVAARATDRCFVIAAHQVFLDREPSEAEVAAWVDRIDRGEARSIVPEELAGSDEWTGAVVRGLYQDALDRDPDPAGLAHWTSKLRDGALVNEVAAAVYGSAEFHRRSGSTDEGFVTELYRRILHRDPDARGLAHWVGAVASAGRTRVAAQFFASTESRRDRVDGLYAGVLGRSPDPGGRAFWVERLLSVNDVRLAVLLASSREFYERHQATACSGMAVGSTVQLSRTPDPSGSNDLDGHVDVSADGRFVTYASHRWEQVSEEEPGEYLDVVVVVDRLEGTEDLLWGNHSLSNPSMSGDGRFVAFDSYASDLVLDDPNAHIGDVFVWDRWTDQMTRVSDGTGRIDGDGDSEDPDISQDGRYVVYQSRAENMVAGDQYRTLDIFLWDRVTGATTRLTSGTADSWNPSISGDGGVVAFESRARDLTGGGTSEPGSVGVYAWARDTGDIVRVDHGDMVSANAAVSADGRYVAFDSDAAVLEGEPTGHGDVPQVYLWERETGAVQRLSGGSRHTTNPSVSGDGRFVTFQSLSADLVPWDTNGQQDLFVRDRSTGSVARITDGSLESGPSVISTDGGTVAFESRAYDLVPGDSGGRHVYVWDRRGG